MRIIAGFARLTVVGVETTIRWRRDEDILYRHEAAKKSGTLVIPQSCVGTSSEVDAFAKPTMIARAGTNCAEGEAVVDDFCSVQRLCSMEAKQHPAPPRPTVHLLHKLQVQPFPQMACDVSNKQVFVQNALLPPNLVVSK